MASFLNKLLDEHFIHYKNIRPNIINITQTSDWENFCEQHNNILEGITTLNELLENSLMEYTYCKTLLSSIYNKSFKCDIALETDEADFDIKNEHRRDALNIRNSIRYIENIKFKTQNKQFALLHISDKDIRDIAKNVQGQNNLINKTLRTGEKWQRLGTSLAIYSTLFTILFGLKEMISNLCFNILMISLSSLVLLYILLFVVLDIFPKKE